MHFLIDLKDEKSGHNLINNRAMKGNGFDTGMTSPINLHCYFSKNQKNTLNPFPFIARLWIKV